MARDLKLLVVDEDFDKYDTEPAIHDAFERLEKEQINWSYNLCCQQRDALQRSKASYDALLIDNDFGRGIITLAEMLPLEKPTAYITAYDLSGLMMQHSDLIKRAGRGAALVNPEEFRSLGVTLIRKKGKHVGKNVTQQDMNEQIYEFLKRVC